MNRLLSFLAVLMICMTAYAVAPQVATLSHNGEIKTFYGLNALINAHNEAIDGDVITLSPGMFNNIDENDGIHINKSITIYGAGYETDSVAGKFPTIITNMHCEFENTDKSSIVCQGAIIGFLSVGDNAKVQVRNCRLSGGGTSENSESHLINCIGSMSFGGGHHYCMNSILGSSLSGAGEVTFDHCILFADKYNLDNANIRNSFLMLSGWWLENTNQYENTVIFWGDEGGGYIDPHFDVKNLTTDEISNVFVDFPEELLTSIDTPVPETDKSRYHLTERAKAEYSKDGDEIGIHGGYYPWKYELPNPQISVLEVDPESTPDGKLNIRVEVKNK